MATYKVIQDIEAEDKFVGPLTLKQFVFAMGGAFFAYLGLFASSKGATWTLAFFIPISLFGFFMAIPWSKDQPTDVWVLAKIRFFFKPKARVWDQAGIQDLVTITAPKKIERNLTKNLSEAEVKSRLKALAETIDSRGWAVKHSSMEEAAKSITLASDRLIDPAALPQDVPEEDLRDIPDILDEESETLLDNLIEQQTQARKAGLIEKMDRVRRGEPLATINQPEIQLSPPDDTVIIEKREDEEKLASVLKAKREAGDLAYSNMHALSATPQQPLTSDTTDQPDNSTAQATDVKAKPSPVTQAARADIISLARNNDLNVATIARQVKNEVDNDPPEVVISLH